MKYASETFLSDCLFHRHDLDNCKIMIRLFWILSLDWNEIGFRVFWVFACCKLVFASNFLRRPESVRTIFLEEFVGSHQTSKAGCNSHTNHFDDFSNMLKTAPQGICERRAPTDVVIYQYTKRARYNTGTALMFGACWSNLIRSRNLKCAETEFTPFFEVIKVQTKFCHSFFFQMSEAWTFPFLYFHDSRCCTLFRFSRDRVVANLSAGKFYEFPLSPGLGSNFASGLCLLCPPSPHLCAANRALCRHEGNLILICNSPAHMRMIRTKRVALTNIMMRIVSIMEGGQLWSLWRRLQESQ